MSIPLRSMAIIVALLAAGCASTDMHTKIHEHADAFAQKLRNKDEEFSGRWRFMVLEFYPPGFDQRQSLPHGAMDSELHVRETLEMALTDAELHVVERWRVDDVLREQDFQHRAWADERTACQLGRMVGASHIVMGSYNFMGDRYHVMPKCVVVETGDVLLADRHWLIERPSRYPTWLKVVTVPIWGPFYLIYMARQAPAEVHVSDGSESHHEAPTHHDAPASTPTHPVATPPRSSPPSRPVTPPRSPVRKPPEAERKVAGRPRVRVLARGESWVRLDQGSQQGLGPGMVYRIRDGGSREEKGIVEVETVDDASAEGRIVRGRYEIKAGDAGEPRQDLDYWDLSLAFGQLPIRDGLQANTPGASGQDRVAHGFLSARWNTDLDWFGWELGSGHFDTKAVRGWMGETGPFLRLDLVPEITAIHLGCNAGGLFGMDYDVTPTKIKFRNYKPILVSKLIDGQGLGVHPYLAVHILETDSVNAMLRVGYAHYTDLHWKVRHKFTRDDGTPIEERKKISVDRKDLVGLRPLGDFDVEGISIALAVGLKW